MSDPRPDTDEHADPGGTSTQGQDNLIRKPATPGGDADSASAVPGAHEADDQQREHGKAVKPGN